MFVLKRFEYSGQDYTVFEEVVAISLVPAKLISYATETIEGWSQDNETNNWYYGNRYMPDYRVERILELK